MDAYAHTRFYKKERRKFSLITYFLTAVLLFLSAVQWYFINELDKANEFFTKQYWVGSIFFAVGLVLFAVFIFFEALRFTVPINWIFAIVILECAVMGVSSLVVRHQMYQLVLSLVVWAVVLGVFLLCGSYLPHDITLDIVVLFVLAIVALIGAMYFLMLHIVTNMPYYLLIHRAFVLGSIWMFVMYHAQIINGGKFAEMRTKDYLLAALMLFHDFLLMFMPTFHFASKWSDSCDPNVNKTKMLVFINDP
ncbi:uncharacterized protein LOC113565167 isoform X1 [Drosophila persimilis]|uniref:uncharacterized protein LOC113565167 isoform X1 n=1 Tax=Drosophila persimilis TaxID=7234 RepID=UPI000F0821DE|nr:uncharacterized protein LOC113565167 isoform X1 [Drosophila persimilis]